MFNFNKELTIEGLGAEIKNLIEKEVLGKNKGKWHIHKLKTLGFGLRVSITLVEEENPLHHVIARKPVYRRPKTITVSSGFTARDLDFLQKYKISAPHDPPVARKQPEEDCLLSQIRSMIVETLDDKTGYCLQLMLMEKYGTGLRVHLSAMQEDNPQLIVAGKISKVKPKKSGSGFSSYDLEFLDKNGLIGF